MLPVGVDPSYTMAIFDDFTELDPSRWVSGNDGSTVTDSVLNLPGGWLSMPTDAGEGADSYRDRTSPAALFQPGYRRPVVAAVSLKLTEANVNQAGIWFGLTDTNTDGFLTDLSHNPPSVFDGFVWFKKPGTSVWQFIASNGSTRQVLPNAGAFTSGEVTELRIQLNVTQIGHDRPMQVNPTPILNGVNMLGSGRGVTCHVPADNLSTMRLGFGVKAGSASVETLLVDSVAGWQAR